MWTAAAFAAALTAIGFVLKGILARVAMMSGIWLLKKTVIVWFWTSPSGQRLWRGVRWRAYRNSSPYFRRKLLAGYRGVVTAVLAAHEQVERFKPW